MPTYRSRFEAYPFLSESPEDLRCDFEILTDELTSTVGLLRSLVQNEQIHQELLWIAELIYHLNPSLRMRLSVTDEEICALEAAVRRLEKQTGQSGFVLPVGTQPACLAHILRSKFKALVRLLYRHAAQGHDVEPALLDVANLLSGYFFLLALRLNAVKGVPETPFSSRVYFAADIQDQEL